MNKEKSEQTRLLRLARDGKCSLPRLLIKATDWRTPVPPELGRVVLEKASFDDVRFYLIYWPHPLDDAYWSRLLELAVKEPNGSGALAQAITAWHDCCLSTKRSGRWSELETLLLQLGDASAIQIYLDDLAEMSAGRWKEGEVHLLCKAL